MTCRSSSAPIRIGTAGWTIPRLAAGHFSSDGTHLERYSRVFSCGEINSSFYRPHKIQTWERWARSVPDGFLFSVKAPKAITHEARLNCGSELLLPFLQQVGYLGEKFGPVLLQLPPSLEFDSAVARRFLASLREHYSGEIVWEARHARWFESGVDALLLEYKFARVAADPACVAAAGLPGGVETLAYFRLHVSPRVHYSSYSDEYLTKLAGQFVRLAARPSAWCVFDNTASGAAGENALALQAKVRRSCDR
jgi:uncharacterized protein YecE (DUF72 family)